MKVHQLNEHSSALGNPTTNGGGGSLRSVKHRLEPKVVQQESLRREPDSSTHEDKKPGSSEASLRATERQLSFYEVAFEKGTEKVTLHAYQDIYERYLPVERNHRVKILEIGLGCESEHLAAASYNTWLEYYPNADLYFIERDEGCVTKRQDQLRRATILTGDVTEKIFLDKFQVQHGSSFDVIVSSSGLTTMQQVASLEMLWKTVNPGGVYFCEYLETSYLEKYGAGKAASNAKGTMVQHLHKMMEDLMYPDPNLEAYHLKGMGLLWPRKVQFEEVESIKHIDCERQICAVLKRAD